jgi:anti-sigma B factor antagonist
MLPRRTGHGYASRVSRGEPDGLRRPPVEGIDRHDGSIVVRLAGELDLYNADEVRAALADAAGEGPSNLVVDLTEVTFLDSTSLGNLIEAKKELPNGTRFRLAAPGPEVSRALEVSGLAQHFDVRDSVEDALSTE